MGVAGGGPGKEPAVRARDSGAGPSFSAVHFKVLGLSRRLFQNEWSSELEAVMEDSELVAFWGVSRSKEKVF